MTIYSRYSGVIEADGSRMTVRTALALINDVLFQVLEGRDERLDRDTRFCIDWYSQFGHASGPYGQADVLAKANNVSVAGLQRAGVLQSQGGRVRLLRREEMPA